MSQPNKRWKDSNREEKAHDEMPGLFIVTCEGKTKSHDDKKSQRYVTRPARRPERSLVWLSTVIHLHFDQVHILTERPMCNVHEHGSHKKLDNTLSLSLSLTHTHTTTYWYTEEKPDSTISTKLVSQRATLSCTLKAQFRHEGGIL